MDPESTVNTIVRKVDQINPNPDDVKIAADIIKDGGTVVFPTETVYGLGADAYNKSACRKIFEIKRRPLDNPLIIHVDSIPSAFNLIDLDRIDKRIIEKLWPGPITIVANSRAVVPDIVSSGLETLAVRIPANPLALDFIKASKTYIAAPSANLSTMTSIVDSSEAISVLNGLVNFIFDSGRTFFGIESTIVDVRGSMPHVLRPGAFTSEEIMQLFGRSLVDPEARGLKEPNVLVAPGMKYRHYAPDIPLYLIEDLDDLIDFCNMRKKNDFVALVSEEMSKFLHCDTIIIGSEDNPYQIARDLFPNLKKAENSGKSFAVIQSVREMGIGLAVMNRIRKASIKGPLPP